MNVLKINLVYIQKLFLHFSFSVKLVYMNPANETLFNLSTNLYFENAFLNKIYRKYIIKFS